MQVKRRAAILSIVVMILMMYTGCSAGYENITEDLMEEQETVQPEQTTEPSENETEDGLMEPDGENQSEWIEISDLDVISDQKMQKKVLKLLQKDSVKSVYTQKYQDAAETVLKRLKKKNTYDLDAPLVIVNPFGTITNGLYFYYESEQACNITYTVSVDHEGIPDFTAELSSGSNQSVVTVHEGLILGLMPGMKNYLTITETNAKGKAVNSKVYCINLEPMKVSHQVLFTEERMDDVKNMTEGLFWLMSKEESELSAFWIVDSYGVKRLEIQVEAKLNLDVEIVEDYLVYPKDRSTLVVANRFGKAAYLYSLDGYQYEGGISYNPNTGCIYVIASDLTKESRADVILSVSLGDGIVSKVIDLNESIQSQSTVEVELESLDFFGEDQFLVSSENTSSIFCIRETEEGTAIEYVVAQESIWKDTSITDLVYQAIGSFDPFTKQKQIQVTTEDKRLIEGQYYITMLNQNNDTSEYYKIFVDENTSTFTLAERIELNQEHGYSIQLYEDHLIYLERDQVTELLPESDDDSTEESETRAATYYFGKMDSEGSRFAEFYISDDEFIPNFVKKINSAGLWTNE